MKLRLIRFIQINNATLGILYVDGRFECFTLEDVQRDLGPNGEGKVAHETAIPTGTYDIVMTMSPKFKRILPWLQGVPFFTEILMHGGNKDADTWGCILVGDAVTKDGTIAPGSSSPAVDRIVKKLQDSREKLSIEVVDRVER